MGRVYSRGQSKLVRQARALWDALQTSQNALKARQAKLKVGYMVRLAEYKDDPTGRTSCPPPRPRPVNASAAARHATGSEPLLEVDGLKVSFRVHTGGLWGHKRELKAVDGVDLTLAPGETLGIVGDHPGARREPGTSGRSGTRCGPSRGRSPTATWRSLWKPRALRT